MTWWKSLLPDSAVRRRWRQRSPQTSATILDRTVYWLFRLSIAVTRPLPLRLGYWFGERVALLCYWVIFPRHRKALNANLAHVLQTDDAAVLSRIARRSFRNFGRYVIDFIHFPAITHAEVRRRLRFGQWDELNAAANSGRGVIIATLHFGNWDLGAAALAATGYKINAVADRFRYARMNELVQGSRAKLGMRVIGDDRVGPTVFRALRRGELLAMLVDVTTPESGIRVNFFGAPALVSPAAARIALRTGAWVVPAVVLRGDDPTLICPIIDASLRDYHPSGDEERDVSELTQLIMRSMEDVIRRHPDQWFIFRRMWNGPRPERAGAGRLAEEI
jgi:KDO2-lipid IV(A) lauroyltransferase